jgi:hypothetical protein
MIFQSVVYHRGIVLIDFAAQRGNRDPHIFASLKISNYKLPIPNV